MIEADLLLSILLTPAFAVLLVTLAQSKRAAELITIGSVVLVGLQALGLVAAVIADGQISAFGDVLYLDAFGALILIPIAGVGFVAALYSINYMGRQYEREIVDDRH